jgi:hypothetical protein
VPQAIDRFTAGLAFRPQFSLSYQPELDLETIRAMISLPEVISTRPDLLKADPRFG